MLSFKLEVNIFNDSSSGCTQPALA